MSTRAFVAAIALALPIGCASAPPPPPPPPAPEPAPSAAPAPAPTTLLVGPSGFSGLVARIEQRGATTSADVLQRVVVGRVGEAYDPARVQEDIKKLFALGIYEDISVQAEPHPSGVALTYVVVERAPIERVALGGVKALPEPEIAALVAELRGKRANPALIARGAQLITQHYVDAGYRKARVDVDTSTSETGQVEVRYVIEEGPKITIERFAFTGNAKVREPELRKQIHTEKGAFNAVNGVYHAERLARDALLITALYYDRGMLQANVGAPEIAPSADGSKLVITVPIDEGQVFRVKKIEISDRTGSQGKKKPGALRTRAGEVVNRGKVIEDVQRLRDWYKKELGRDVDVTTETELDAAKGTVNLTLVVSG
jgi:outer membrane protein insertion porin family